VGHRRSAWKATAFKPLAGKAGISDAVRFADPVALNGIVQAGLAGRSAEIGPLAALYGRPRKRRMGWRGWPTSCTLMAAPKPVKRSLSSLVNQDYSAARCLMASSLGRWGQTSYQERPC